MVEKKSFKFKNQIFVYDFFVVEKQFSNVMILFESFSINLLYFLTKQKYFKTEANKKSINDNLITYSNEQQIY